MALTIAWLFSASSQPLFRLRSSTHRVGVTYWFRAGAAPIWALNSRRICARSFLSFFLFLGEDVTASSGSAWLHLQQGNEVLLARGRC